MSDPNVPPKRPRGRPKGAIGSKWKPEETQRAENAPTLDELNALAPVEQSDAMTKRFSPAAFRAAREKALLDIKDSFPAEKFEQLLCTLRERPSMYSPEGLKTWVESQRELACVIEGVKRAEAEGRTFLYGNHPADFTHCNEHPHHKYVDNRPAHLKRESPQSPE